MAKLYRFAASGGLIHRFRVPIGLPASIHDFVLSPTYAIFWVSPYVLDFAAMRDGASVLDALEWCPELGSRLLVAAREDGRVVAEVPVGRGYSLHSINAYEPGPGRLVIDAVELEEPAYPSYLLDQLLAAAPLGRPVRLEVDLERGLVTDRVVGAFDLAPDFPVIAPSRAGQEAPEVWLLGMSAARSADRKFFDTLARVPWSHHHQVDQWQAPAGQFLVGEPVVIEADGEPACVLCPAFGGEQANTRLLAFAARDIAAGPVASLNFGSAIAPGFHACWWPGKRQAPS
jgi:carotenoid cleavage dioxygenase-like enzyme